MPAKNALGNMLKAKPVFILLSLKHGIKIFYLCRMSQKISTDKAPKPVGLYPHARKVGNLLFLSGIGPRTVTDEIPGLKLDKNGNFQEFDFEVFDNVKIVLEESGSSWDQLVDVTVFLVNMKRDFAVYNKIYAEYFKDNQPCRTTVEINSLPTPIAIELKCIATID
jgi:2-aminomuconate deaminase